ncbi:type II 3-dehydroquinate dehydratase [Anaerostipes sp.]|uniref:type II 3-dehydroquinate dehydratase n=1 Tax=Anaerostipes sp. TaxID=1872530 RepID=UPI0025BB8CF0|nr:type II 3-dehydroquinate dehydratase [Anaerostipes sp.]MBS7009384.1 type II 3-dehydroquinate dehydratase [Anaerostipes sp.]
MKKVMMLHCVNHNMYGKRDPKQYGTITLEQINELIGKTAEEEGIRVDTFQTNHEGEMVDKIHQVFYEKYDGVIINPGAWTHYNYAIHDALEILECPILEVHMSNIFNRESFRSHSVIAPVAAGMIAGMGESAYTLAVKAFAEMFQREGK